MDEVHGDGRRSGRHNEGRNNKNGLNEKERRISSVSWADNIPRIVAGAGDEPQWGGPEPSPQIYLALLISTHGSKDKS
jgi:hypothetical protein